VEMDVSAHNAEKNKKAQEAEAAAIAKRQLDDEKKAVAIQKAIELEKKAAQKELGDVVVGAETPATENGETPAPEAEKPAPKKRGRKSKVKAEVAEEAV